jgi:hypothetical protein
MNTTNHGKPFRDEARGTSITPPIGLATLFHSDSQHDESSMITTVDFNWQLAQLVGKPESIRLWPYRYEGTQFLALDVDGKKDSVSTTITVGKHFKLVQPCSGSIDLEADSFTQALKFALDTVQVLTGRRDCVCSRNIKVGDCYDKEWPVPSMFLADPGGDVLIRDGKQNFLFDIHQELVERVGHPCDISCELCEKQGALSIRLNVSGNTGQEWLKLHDRGFMTHSWSDLDAQCRFRDDDEEECLCLPDMRDGVDLFYAVSLLTQLLTNSNTYSFPAIGSGAR